MKNIKNYTSTVPAIFAALMPPIETQCCKRDHDHDGNCDQHPLGWAQKLQAEVERLTKELEEAQLSRRSLSPGDKRWIFVNSKIRQVIVEEIYIRASLYRVTAVSVNCRGKNGMICYEDLKPEELFFTEADCRASVEAVGLE